MATTMTMQTMGQTGDRESVDAAFHRLAAEARRQGVTVYKVEGAKGPAWFSPSRSRPGTAHALTAVSCDCDGFLRWQRCRHLAALLDRLGWLPVLSPDPPTPTQEAATSATSATSPAIGRPSAPSCPFCHGRGWSYSAWFASEGATRPPCRMCSGSGDPRAAA
jgi:hypothetical protein